MLKKLFSSKTMAAFFAALFCAVSPALASEADLVVPSIKDANPDFFNYLLIGIAISVIGLVFGFIEFLRIKKLDVHTAMAEVGNTIFETCKTYLIQQGKFLLVLEVLIGLCIAFYFACKRKNSFRIFKRQSAEYFKHSVESRYVNRSLPCIS